MPRVIVSLRDALSIYKYVGERARSEAGYVLLWDDGLGRYVGEHRVVAERALGRPLCTEEEVHHVNGKRDDNSNRNLVVCLKQYHKYLDACMRLRRGTYTSRYTARQIATIRRFLRSRGKSSSRLQPILEKLCSSTRNAIPKSGGSSRSGRRRKR